VRRKAKLCSANETRGLGRSQLNPHAKSLDIGAAGLESNRPVTMLATVTAGAAQSSGGGGNIERAEAVATSA